MRWRHSVVLVLLSVALILSTGAEAAAKKLVVYTYDSFVSWGPANQIEAGFEKLYNVDVVFVAPSDSGEMLARLIGEMEMGGTSADVFLGLSDSQLSRAESSNLFRVVDKSKVPNLAAIPADLQFDRAGRVLPFDHGYITLVVNNKALKASEWPRTFEDLTHPRFAKKIIAIDPRSSSVGHAFLMWTISRYGEKGFVDYWKRLNPNLLTITGGWSAAYEMFENGEAPIVVSYATDAAYAVMDGKGPIYTVLTLDGEGYRQIEGVGIVRTTKEPDLAHAFVNYLLSPEVQSLIPTTNWMYPANPRAKLPPEWVEYAKPPQKWARLESHEIGSKEATWLWEWAKAISM